MIEKRERNDIPSSGQKVDLSNLGEVTDADKALMSKYIGIFLKTAPEELKSIQAALEMNDGTALYKGLHGLKPHVELMGIKNVLSELKEAETNLLETGQIAGSVRTWCAYLVNEISVACLELENIIKNY
jgi:hypothetical protein